MLRSLAASLAGTAAALLARPVSLDLHQHLGMQRSVAPRRFGDVTIRAHQDFVPKPPLAERVTVSDFTEPYTPGRKGKGRPAASYRAARRNAGRTDRRRHLALFVD